MSDETKEVSAEEAKAALAADKAKRARECGEAIDQLLTDHRCQIVGRMVLAGGSLPQMVFDVAAKD